MTRTPLGPNSAAQALVSSSRPALPWPRPGGRLHPMRSPPRSTYLASDDASFVHGAILDVDGGRAAT